MGSRAQELVPPIYAVRRIADGRRLPPARRPIESRRARARTRDRRARAAATSKRYRSRPDRGQRVYQLASPDDKEIRRGSMARDFDAPCQSMSKKDGDPAF